VAGHVAPGAPDVLFGPLVRQIVDTDAWQGGLEVPVVWEGPRRWLDGTGGVLRHGVVVASLERLSKARGLTVCQRWRARAATGEAQFKLVGWVGIHC
jgi:hypothetical protein